MIILSLFDGISCGRLALERAGIKVDKYYASEIDKHAITIAQKNYPDTIQLGDINNWINWDIDLPDLIIGGSPCQGFSFAGKQLAFDDPRSKLFWQFAALLRFCKPKFFLLENVRMKKEHMQVITDTLGVKPVCINSSLVSAQNRVRYYWCNWDITQPDDKGICLKDIIDNGVVDKTKSYCIDANYYKGGNLKLYFEKYKRQLVFAGEANINAYRQRKAVYSSEGLAPTLTAASGGNHHPKVAVDDKYYRNLSVVECERLQTLPDNWTSGISNTQRYRAIGNGWTVDVVAHIFRCINNKP